MSRRDEPAWVGHSIWWHVYPLGFTGADTTGVDRCFAPRLDRVTNWLDHAVELGVNGLALGPIFDSGTHGYDTIDHFAIDPRLGDADAFARLVAAARERGIRIMLDGVFNHVGTGFAGLDGDRAGWVRRDHAGSVATFEGHDHLLALDHDNPEVAGYVTSVLNHWLDAGADAWRLDAAYAVPARFWASVLPAVRDAHPEVYVLGEMLHGDYSDYVQRSGVDAVTQYELWKAIWSSIESRNFFELDWSLRRHDGFLDAFVPYTFLGNHDVTRLASRITDPRHREHALVLLLTLAGTPSVYYGDEFGMSGVKQDRAGGDDAVRPAFPAEPARTTCGSQDMVFGLYRSLIGLRRRHPWLHRARSESWQVTNESVVLRVSSGSDALVVALNLGERGLRFGVVSTVVAGAAEVAQSQARVAGHGWAVLR